MRQFSDPRQPFPGGPQPAALATLRKLIRSKASKLFLTKAGGWTDQIRLAMSFADHAEAMAAVQQHRLREVELYYLFGEDRITEYDFPIQF